MRTVSSQPRSRATVRRIATGALMTTLFVGGTAGTALAATDSAQPLARPTLVVSVSAAAQNAASGPATASPTVSSWSAIGVNGGSVTAVKSTPVRWFEPNQHADDGRDIGGRIALVWAVAAAVVMAGVLAGTVLNRR